MHLRRTGFVVCLTAAAVLGGCQTSRQQTEALLDDFADFDRAYIPALMMTRKDLPAVARAGMRQLHPAWRELKANQQDAFPDDEQWRADFERVDELIFTASEFVAETKIDAAHARIEPVRDVFLTLRTTRGIDYYLDKLVAFHAPMARIVRPATTLTPDELTDVWLAAFRQNLETAQNLWLAVEAAPIPAERFEFSESAVRRARRLIEAQREALQRLDAALIEREAGDILAAARALHDPFMQLYVMFGDFPR